MLPSMQSSELTAAVRAGSFLSLRPAAARLDRAGSLTLCCWLQSIHTSERDLGRVCECCLHKACMHACLLALKASLQTVRQEQGGSPALCCGLYKHTYK